LKVLILTESGPNIGFGHLVRMNVIKEYLEEHSIPCNIKTFDSTLANEKIYLDWVNTRDWESFVDKETIAIIDSYLASEEKYSEISHKCKKLISIDDFNRIRYHSDIIINPNVYFDSMNYTNQNARLFGGLEYILLRKSIREYTANNKEDCEGILITFGGVDLRNLYPRFLCLGQKEEKVTIICPDEEQIESLREECTDNGVELLGMLRVEDLLGEFCKAKIVISGCGQTLHELAYLKKNTVGICLDKDQILNQDYYVKTKFLNSRLSWDMVDLEKIVQKEVEQVLSQTSFKNQNYQHSLDPNRNLLNYLALIND